MKKRILILISLLGLFGIIGCNDAMVASSNLSKDADMFRIYRRVVFYNGITDKYILSIEGFCSIKKDGYDGQLEVTIKTSNNTFMKHYLGISDNVTYFVEQLNPANVSDNNYKIIFKPSVIIPSIEIN